MTLHKNIDNPACTSWGAVNALSRDGSRALAADSQVPVKLGSHQMLKRALPKQVYARDGIVVVVVLKASSEKQSAGRREEDNQG